MKHTRPLAVLAMLCVSAPLFAETEFEPRLWMPDLGGSVKVARAGLGTEITLPDTLGFSDEQASEVRLTWRTAGPVVVRFAYVPLSYGGNANLSHGIDFAGSTFQVAFDVASDLEIEYGRVGLGLLFRAGEKLRIGPVVELKAMRIQAELAGSLSGAPVVSASESTEGGFASFGFGFDANPMTKVHLVGEVGYSPGLEYGDLVEAELGLKYSPVKMASVFGGYRVIDLDLQVDNDTANLELSGPYVGASLRF